MSSASRLAAIALAALLLAAAPAAAAPTSHRPVRPAELRLDRVGLRPADRKRVLVLARRALGPRRFRVTLDGALVLHGRLHRRVGRWSARFPDVYALDLTRLRRPGRYRVLVHGALPVAMVVRRGRRLYRPLLANAVRFFQAQRDGRSQAARRLHRRPSHLLDAHARIFARPTYDDDVLQGALTRARGSANVAGGWFDAGDYLKLVETASYSEAVMEITLRDHPTLRRRMPALAHEARFGLRWLLRAFHPRTGVLIYQVGIGDGDWPRVWGDHDVWRLPQADDHRRISRSSPKRYLKWRPAFRAGRPGRRISPNLAGRLAADFGLCAQIWRRVDRSLARRCLHAGERVFALARTSHVTSLLTASPHDYYPEVEWRDDLELGAAELALATNARGMPRPRRRAARYLHAGAHWAAAHMRSPTAGDTLNLYDVSGLAHPELARALAIARARGPHVRLAVHRRQLLAALRRQLRPAAARARVDPFGLGLRYASGEDLVPHALGLLVEARAYDRLAGRPAFARLEQRELDWTLGANAWGVSFVVGAGARFPHCLHDQIANLSGSLDGGRPLMLGAVVDGPTDAADFQDLGLPDGARSCPAGGFDVYHRYSGRGVRFMDDARAWPSVEPTIDYTALTLPAFADLAGRG